MLTEAELVAFVATANLDAAIAFYEGVLGFAVVDQSPFAAVIDANGTMLRLTPVDGYEPQGHTNLGWRVSDIEAASDVLASAGVVFLRYEGMDQDNRGIWTTPSQDRIAWFADPDGNILSIGQHPGLR